MVAGYEKNFDCDKILLEANASVFIFSQHNE